MEQGTEQIIQEARKTKMKWLFPKAPYTGLPPPLCTEEALRRHRRSTWEDERQGWKSRNADTQSLKKKSQVHVHVTYFS